MRSVDIRIASVVHRLQVNGRIRDAQVQVCCDHGEPEAVLAVLSGSDLNCEDVAAVLERLLHKRVPFAEACRWAHVPVRPIGIHRGLWKAPHIKRRWMLHDLERWRKEGRTPEQAAEICARYPHRVPDVRWPA
jgi:hypothetical protein